MASFLGKSVSCVLYAFGYQVQLIGIYRDIEKERAEITVDALTYFTRVVTGAMVSCLLLFSLTGVFGTYAFCDNPGGVSGDVLHDLAGVGDVGTAARCVMIGAISLAAQLIVNPSKDALMNLIGGGDDARVLNLRPRFWHRTLSSRLRAQWRRFHGRRECARRIRHQPAVFHSARDGDEDPSLSLRQRRGGEPSWKPAPRLCRVCARCYARGCSTVQGRREYLELAR